MNRISFLQKVIRIFSFSLQGTVIVGKSHTKIGNTMKHVRLLSVIGKTFGISEQGLVNGWVKRCCRCLSSGKLNVM